MVLRPTNTSASAKGQVRDQAFFKTIIGKDNGALDGNPLVFPLDHEHSSQDE